MVLTIPWSQSDPDDALERLLRYTLRPLAKERLSVHDGGRTVVLKMKRVWSHGTHIVEFSRVDFVGKLAAAEERPDRLSWRSGWTFRRPRVARAGAACAYA